MLLYFHNLSLHEILLLASKERLKCSNLTPIKLIFSVFADTWKSCVYTLKTALKEMLLKGTITQTNF